MIATLMRKIQNLIYSSGHSSQKSKNLLKTSVVELDGKDIELINYVLDKKYSMASTQRLVNTIKSCRYVVENNIPGDFVECGVWRGGNGILAKKDFEQLGSNKNVWMYDTFEGMTEPTSVDVEAINQLSAQDKFLKSQTATHNEWCYSSLEDVQKNCCDAGLEIESFSFVKGDVCETLRTPKNIPDQISDLRLDTDWDESSKAELEILFPKLG